VNDAVAHNRAWHLATSFLSFPNEEFVIDEEEPFSPSAVRGGRGKYVMRMQLGLTREVKDAMVYLLKSAELGISAGDGNGESLVEWYICEVRRHFLGYVKPALVEIEVGISLALLIFIDTSQIKVWHVHWLTDQASGTSPEEQLTKILQQLKISSNIYNTILKTYLVAKTHHQLILEFRQSVQSIIAYSLPIMFPSLLYKTLHAYTNIILELPTTPEVLADVALFTSPHIPNPEDHIPTSDLDLDLSDEEKERLAEEESTRRREEARASLIVLVESLQSVGLMASAIGERVFAGVVDVAAGEWVIHRFSGEWEQPENDEDNMIYTEPRNVKGIIEEWLNVTLIPLITSVLSLCHPPSSLPQKQPPHVQTLLQRLSNLRLTELFDMIVDFPSSLPGIMDLKPSLTTPTARTNLTTSFAASLSARLLHPGASTVDILRAYISMIKCFKILDPKGVLLQRVGNKVTKYLNTRDDTVVEIVKGILADYPDSDDEEDMEPEDSMMDGSDDGSRRRGRVEEEESDENVLRELGVELMSSAHAAEHLGPAATTGLDELDFDNMNWMPDPVDAGPDYRQVQGTDIISHLLGLQNNEQFIREFQNQLAQRLLRAQSLSTFARETQILELLKLRFGEGPLQNCMVMLKDIIESRRLDSNIRSTKNLGVQPISTQTTSENPAEPEMEKAPELHAKILSRLFWPDVKEEEFKLPSEIQNLLQRFDQGFESLKKSRKLKWLAAEGTVSLELDFDDGTIVPFKDVPTWAASVIYAFSDDDDAPQPQPRTIQTIARSLQMAETLVKRALSYWRDKGVVIPHPSVSGAFAIKETWGKTAAVASGIPYSAPYKHAMDLLPNMPGHHHTRARSMSNISSSSFGNDDGDDNVSVVSSYVSSRAGSPVKHHHHDHGDGGMHSNNTNVDVGQLPEIPEGQMLAGAVGVATGEESIGATAGEQQQEEAMEETLPPNLMIASQFILGMLTNLGTMDTGRIMMMLGMMVPGGVTFGEGELKDLLGRMERDGKVEAVQGGSWKIRK